MTGSDLRRNALNAQDLLHHLNDRKPFAIIFLLDCCRTYHLRNPHLAARSESASDSAPNGLKPMHEAGSLIAFACAPGTTAKDGRGQRNGLFTKHLLQYLPTPDKDIRLVLSYVTRDVKVESKLLQIPFYTVSFTHDDICLYGQGSSSKYFLTYYYEESRTSLVSRIKSSALRTRSERSGYRHLILLWKRRMPV